MDLLKYQLECRKFAVYPEKHELIYPMIGLANEVGEALGKLKKVMRGDVSIDEQRKAILDELGDVLWYLTMSSHALGATLEDVADMNIEKLSRRADRGTIKGEGDSR